MRAALQPAPRRWLWVAGVASFLTPFMGSSLNVALPVLGRELAATPLHLTWIVNAFLITAAGALIPLGQLADAWGRARVLTLGLGAQALCSLAAAWAPSVGLLVAARALQGVAGAATFATAVALVSQLAPPGQRGKLLGANTALVYLGLTLGPPAGGWLAERWGWRSIFTVTAGIALAGALAGQSQVSPASDSPRNSTVAGSWVFAPAVSTTLAGLALARADARFLFLTLVGLVGVGLSFILSAVPPLPSVLFRNLAFVCSNLAAFLHYAATFSVSLLLALYLQLVGGFSPKTTGLVLLAQPLFMALLSPLAGSLSDRFEPRWVASFGMALTALGLLALSGAKAAVSLPLVASGLVLLGVGFALFSSPNTHAIMSQAPVSLLSSASAILALSRLSAQAVSLVLASVFLPRASLHGGEAARLLIPGMRADLRATAALCLVGIAFSLARGKVHNTA
ncbi:MAG: MFS transporter [Thermoanaerobaculum sp.]